MQVKIFRSFIMLLAIGMVFGSIIQGLAYAFLEDLVGAWTLDEGTGEVVNDISGNENHGEFKGAELSQGSSKK